MHSRLFQCHFTMSNMDGLGEMNQRGVQRLLERQMKAGG